MLLKPERPARTTCVLVALASVTVATLVIYPLKQVTPVLSVGVLYVLVVAMFWGLARGILTSVLSAAFNFFHLPPVDRFALTDQRDWAALLAFIAVATGLLAELARLRSSEAEQRRQEADLVKRPCRVIIETENSSKAASSAGTGRLANA
jgi:K+-sensing histidine kinase KdpD